MSAGDDVREQIDRIMESIRSILTTAEEKVFQGWFDRLRKSMPAIDRDTVTLTRDNFRKAMLQAYKAGRASKT
jgi:hypothetical protein